VLYHLNMAGKTTNKAVVENGAPADAGDGKLTLAQRKRLKQKQRKQAKKAER